MLRDASQPAPWWVDTLLDPNLAPTWPQPSPAVYRLADHAPALCRIAKQTASSGRHNDGKPAVAASHPSINTPRVAGRLKLTTHTHHSPAQTNKQEERRAPTYTQRATTTSSHTQEHTCIHHSTVNSWRFCFLYSVSPLPEPTTPTLPPSGTCVLDTTQHMQYDDDDTAAEAVRWQQQQLVFSSKPWTLCTR